MKIKKPLTEFDYLKAMIAMYQVGFTACDKLRMYKLIDMAKNSLKGMPMSEQDFEDTTARMIYGKDFPIGRNNEEQKST